MEYIISKFMVAFYKYAYRGNGLSGKRCHMNDMDHNAETEGIWGKRKSTRRK